MLIWSMWVACQRPDDPALAAKRVPAIELLLPVLAARQVIYLRDQSWCRALRYDRGHFGDSSHPSTCLLDSAPVAPLDATADADLSDWMDRLTHAAGARPMFTELTYAQGGALASAKLTFSLRWSLGAFSYLWAKGGPVLDADQQSVPISGDWSVVYEDWN